MASKKTKTDKSESNRTQIIIAIIALSGVLATGFFANWDKVFSRHDQKKSAESNSDQKKSPESNSDQKKSPESNSDQLAETRAREIIVYIVGQTYRRAFSLNFKTRFVNQGEYASVLKSITEARGAIQSKFVELHVLKPSSAIMVHNLLKKLDAMEETFERMQPFIDGEVGYSDKYLPGRLDGTGQPELTAAFDDMESLRLQFLEDVRHLAEREHIILPDVPVQIPNWGRRSRTK